MPPFDPRHDSDDSHAAVDPHTTPTRSSGVSLEAIKLLEGLTQSMREVRDSQKGLDIKVDALTVSHGDHRVSLDRLRDTVTDLGQRVTKVEAKAEDARTTAVAVNRRISETQHSFDTTLAGVNVATNKIADKTEFVAKETTSQTVTLAKQSEQLEAATTMLATAKRHLPLLLTAATIGGSILAKVLEAFLAVFHH